MGTTVGGSTTLPKHAATPANHTNDPNPAPPTAGRTDSTASKQAKDGAGNVGSPPPKVGKPGNAHPPERPDVKGEKDKAAPKRPDSGDGNTKADPPQQKSTDERLKEIENHKPDPAQLKNLPPEDRADIEKQYAQERSKQYADVATDLEHSGPPSKDDFRIGGKGGKFLEWEYREAVQTYNDQKEIAQQGAKPYREQQMRAELEKTEDGRRMLRFEKEAGVKVRILTDREMDAQGNKGAAGVSYGDSVDIRSGYTNPHVFVHEMTHQVDDKTKILAPNGDGRSKEQVIQDATAAYEKYGLDTREVKAVVEATYHKGDDSGTLSHGHTRLAEAKLHRVELGGTPLTDDEIGEVLQQSVPRELDKHAVDAYANDHDETKLRAYAESRGMKVDGRSADEIVEDLRANDGEQEAKIVAIEQRGTKSAGGRFEGGLGGAAGEAGGKFTGGGTMSGGDPAGTASPGAGLVPSDSATPDVTRAAAEAVAQAVG